VCFAFDARPPDLPAEWRLAPIAGGAGAELLELHSADGTRFSAAIARSAGAGAGDGAGAGAGGNGSGATGVVILPDVRGLYPFYMELAERFAQAGHPAIAIDYFGRTAGLGPRDEQFEYAPHVGALKVPQVQADAAAASAALKEGTGCARIATVGFCLGGFESFLAATSERLDLDRAVGFYGILSGERFQVPGPLERAAATRCPVLGLFGEADQAIPVEQVRAYEAALAEAGVEHEIHVYPGAPHSFFDRRFDEHAEAAQDAWRRVLAFLG
jgi:carboxymethylenebutenolidase